MPRLYAWTTPNGRKLSIALEELDLPYEVVPVTSAKAHNESRSLLGVIERIGARPAVQRGMKIPVVA